MQLNRLAARLAALAAIVLAATCCAQIGLTRSECEAVSDAAAVLTLECARVEDEHDRATCERTATVAIAIAKASCARIDESAVAAAPDP